MDIRQKRTIFFRIIIRGSTYLVHAFYEWDSEVWMVQVLQHPKNNRELIKPLERHTSELNIWKFLPDYGKWEGANHKWDY